MTSVGYDQEWLELEKFFGGRPAFHGDVVDIREQFQAFSQPSNAEPAADGPVLVTNETLKSGIKIRIYKPKTSSSNETLFPTGVYLHGGGFVLGNLETEDADCRHLAEHVSCIIIAVNYRLAPEFSFHDILEDSLEAYDWAWNNVSRLGGDQRAIFSIGSSAGACLALVVTNELINQGLGSRVKGVVAMAPIAAHPESIPEEYRSEYTSYTENAEDVPIINAQVLGVFLQAAQTDPFDSKQFVTLSTLLTEFPKTWIATCEKDPLRDDGVVLEKVLRSYGVQVKREHYMGFGHCFWGFPLLKGRARFLADLIEGVRFVLA